MLLVVAGGASAVESIEVVYGRGRNQVAIKLWTDAETALENDQVELAAKDVDAALRSDPGLYPALYTRAKVYGLQGKFALVVQDCTTALRADSTFVEAALLRANANQQLRNYDASLKEINHVISIHPRIDGLARAFEQRAWMEATCPNAGFRNGQKAIKDATMGCKLLNWRDENGIDTLAAAYAEAGDFDSALRYEQQALSAKDISVYDKRIYQAHLAMLKQHRPIRT